MVIFRRAHSGSYLPEIDGLRFLAIIPVIISHILISIVRNGNNAEVDWSRDAWVYNLLNSGSAGVLLFFGISGFILSKPYFEAHRIGTQLNMRTYFLRRLIRIEPPYFIVLIVFYLAHVFLFHDPGVGVGNLLASLLYSHGFIYNDFSKVNPVAWSLEIEIQFYLLLPFFLKALLKLKNPVAAMLVLVLIFSMISQFVPLEKAHLRLSIFSCFHFFLAGMIVAYQKVNVAKIPAFTNWQSISLVVMSFVIFITGQVYSYTYLYQIQCIAVFVLLFLSQYSRLFSSILSIRLLSIIGGMCYTIYLLHYAMAHLLSKVALGMYSTGYWLGDFFLYVIPLLLLILVICALVFPVLERPFMKLAQGVNKNTRYQEA